MKLKILSLLMAATVANASVTTTYDDITITSSVVHNEGGTYTYSYNITPALFTKQDISHFEIFFCGDVVIANATSSIKFKGELKDESFKFDNLAGNNNKEVLWFTFDSVNAPELGDVAVKYGRVEAFTKAQVPSCAAIPEPSVVCLSTIGFCLLLRRRR
jgi:hypothetical protein